MKNNNFLIKAVTGSTTALILSGCASSSGVTTLQKSVQAGGMNFRLAQSELCNGSATCYSSQNYAFAVSDLTETQKVAEKARNTFGVTIDSPDQYISVDMGNMVRDSYNSSPAAVSKMGVWLNRNGKLSSDNGYKIYIGHVSDSPDQFQFMVNVMCIPEGGACEFDDMASVFDDIEKKLLQGIKI